MLFLHLFFCSLTSGERSHLRDKSDVRSNGQNYILDLYRHSSHIVAKRAIVGNPHSHFAQRVGPLVCQALQTDQVYRRVLGVHESREVDVVQHAEPVFKQAAPVEASDRWRAALLAVARLFDLPVGIVDRLQDPLKQIECRHLSGVRHVSFSTAPLSPGDSVSYRLPGEIATARASVGRVKSMFCALDQIWVVLVPYAFRDIDAAAGAVADAAARKMLCRLTLRSTDYRIVLLRAIERHELVEHEHRFPVAREAYDANVHCCLATLNIPGSSLLRRTVICQDSNQNYVLNLAVSEKRSLPVFRE